MATDTYSERITVRATEGEKKAIEEMADQLDLSRSRYICRVAAGAQLPGEGGADTDVLENLDAISEDLREIREAINRAGRNLNQVARAMNQRRRQDVDAAVIEEAGRRMREAVSVIVEERGDVEKRIEAILGKQQVPDGERAQERFRETAGDEVDEEEPGSQEESNTEKRVVLADSDAAEENARAEAVEQPEDGSASIESEDQNDGGVTLTRFPTAGPEDTSTAEERGAPERASSRGKKAPSEVLAGETFLGGGASDDESNAPAEEGSAPEDESEAEDSAESEAKSRRSGLVFDRGDDSGEDDEEES